MIFFCDLIGHCRVAVERDLSTSGQLVMADSTLIPVQLMASPPASTPSRSAQLMKKDARLPLTSSAPQKWP